MRRLVSAYRDNGGRGRLALQVHLSWAPTTAEAEAIAFDQWRTNVLGGDVPWDVETPAAFDEIGEHVTMESVRRAVLVSSDPAQHAAWLAEYAELGFDDIYLHHVGQEQERFVDTFADRVLPQVRGVSDEAGS